MHSFPAGTLATVRKLMVEMTKSKVEELVSGLLTLVYMQVVLATEKTSQNQYASE